jgi:hypothetical protein
VWLLGDTSAVGAAVQGRLDEIARLIPVTLEGEDAPADAPGTPPTDAQPPADAQPPGDAQQPGADRPPSRDRRPAPRPKRSSPGGAD